MNITIDLILFIFLSILGFYVLYKIEYDIKIIRVLKSYPVVSRVRSEGLIDFTNLSSLIKNYDIEFSTEGPVEVERLGEGVYRVRAKSNGKAVFKIVAYGNFDEYAVEKIVEVLS